MDFGVNGNKPTFIDRIFGRRIISRPRAERPYTTTEDGTSVANLEKLFIDPAFETSSEEVGKALSRRVPRRDDGERTADDK